MSATINPEKAPAASASGASTKQSTRALQPPRPWRATWVPPALVFLLILGLWYAVSYLVLDQTRRFLMPPPDQVVTRAFLVPDVLSEILASLGQTAAVALAGLAAAIVIGMAWGIAMSQAKWIEQSLFPYAVILQCIPILALVPLIGFWFGFEFFSRTVVCVMIALFPVVSNTLFGLQSADRSQLELFRLQNASRWTVLTKLQLPAALPAVFAGMRISAGLAVVGAIVGDFFFRRGTPGIGSLISNYQSRVESAELFAAIITASLFGVLIFWLFGWITKLVIGSWYDVDAR
ncbi:ABC transporter permease [Arthrobacter sp. NPDC058127]|uniref:ABC transporter permease n=1 Tax=Arthrobacter sp. NPDC058127 TaxID=3346351 RepID=UPI0036E6C6A8